MRVARDVPHVRRMDMDGRKKDAWCATQERGGHHEVPKDRELHVDAALGRTSSVEPSTTRVNSSFAMLASSPRNPTRISRNVQAKGPFLAGRWALGRK